MCADIAWDYGTRAWQQRLVYDGPQWRLARRTNESRVEDVEHRADARAHLASVELDPAVRLVAPTYTGDEAEYPLLACEVLASQLWPELRQVGRSLEHAMTSLGAALGRLHTSAGPTEGLERVVSPHLLRLRAHLDAAPGTWAGQVVAQLAPSVVGSLRRWLDDLDRGDTLCHGGFSLGSVFVDQDVTRIEILAGDELMRSTPELDLGWMLGELTEIEFQAGLRGGNGLAYAGAAEWFLEGWTSVTGVAPDRHQVDRVIALRNFLQACDVAETTRSINAAERGTLFLTYLVERVAILDAVASPRGAAA